MTTITIGTTIISGVIFHGSLTGSGSIQTSDENFPLADKTYAASKYQGVNVLEYRFKIKSPVRADVVTAIAAINSAPEGTEFWPDETRFGHTSSAFARETSDIENKIWQAECQVKLTTSFLYSATMQILDTEIYGVAEEITNNGHFPAPPDYISVVGSYPHTENPYLEIRESDGVTVLAQWGMLAEVKEAEEIELWPDQELMKDNWTADFDPAIWARNVSNQAGCSCSAGSLFVPSGGWCSWYFGGGTHINFCRSIQAVITATITGVAAAAKLMYQDQPNGPWKLAGLIVSGVNIIEIPVTGSLIAEVIPWSDSTVGSANITISSARFYCERKVPISIVPTLDCGVPKRIMILATAGEPESVFARFRNRLWF